MSFSMLGDDGARKKWSEFVLFHQREKTIFELTVTTAILPYLN
ncbi:MAG: hypothetical protein ACI92E_002953 [Oceanicoccus sp.]|jgi:hypothetical protein